MLTGAALALASGGAVTVGSPSLISALLYNYSLPFVVQLNPAAEQEERDMFNATFVTQEGVARGREFALSAKAPAPPTQNAQLGSVASPHDTACTPRSRRHSSRSSSTRRPPTLRREQRGVRVARRLLLARHSCREPRAATARRALG